MLAHHGRGYPCNLFTLMELHYTDRLNTKGLLKSNPDMTVAYAKPAYYAAQNVFSIFDDSLVRIPNFASTVVSKEPVSLYAYRDRVSGGHAITVWNNLKDVPEVSEAKSTDIFLKTCKIPSPVMVDLKSGEVFAIPKSNWASSGTGIQFKNIPVSDSPILITDRSVLLLTNWVEDFSEKIENLLSKYIVLVKIVLS